MAHVVLMEIVEKNGIYLESLLVSQEVRGMGFGRKMMEFAEEHARKQGAPKIWLNTKDKQEFYRHLGYKDSTFVTPVRESQKFLGTEKVQQLNRLLGSPATSEPAQPETKQIPSPLLTNNTTKLPPPPPLPIFSKSSSFLTWMNKDLP